MASYDDASTAFTVVNAGYMGLVPLEAPHALSVLEPWILTQAWGGVMRQGPVPVSAMNRQHTVIHPTVNRY